MHPTEMQDGVDKIKRPGTNLGPMPPFRSEINNRELGGATLVVTAIAISPSDSG
jgi:hypothetical protein